MNIQKNLRFYRLNNKLTQEKLSEKADLTDKYISDLYLFPHSFIFNFLEIVLGLLFKLLAITFMVRLL